MMVTAGFWTYTQRRRKRFFLQLGSLLRIPTLHIEHVIDGAYFFDEKPGILLVKNYIKFPFPNSISVLQIPFRCNSLMTSIFKPSPMPQAGMLLKDFFLLGRLDLHESGITGKSFKRTSTAIGF
jgi:hypothetical protein